MGRGSSGIGTGGGGSKTVPTEDAVKMGNASYLGLPVRFDGDMSADARNHETYIAVSNKFFHTMKALKEAFLTMKWRTICQRI